MTTTAHNILILLDYKAVLKMSTMTGIKMRTALRYPQTSAL